MILKALKDLVGFFNEGRESKNRRGSYKKVEKDLKKNKYHIFYALRFKELTPAFGDFFYKLYKTVAHAGASLKKAAHSRVLKHIIIENFMDEERLRLWNQFSPNTLIELVKILPPEELIPRVNQARDRFFKIFNPQWIERVDTLYNLVLDILWFVTFDFSFLLEKFDSRLSKQNFSYKPRFKPVEIQFLLEYIKDFWTISADLTPQKDWKTALRILKQYKSTVDIKPAAWYNLILLLQDIHRSNILPLMIQHGTQEPLPWHGNPHERVQMAACYLEAHLDQAQKLLTHLLHNQQRVHTEALIRSIFNSLELTSLQYYSDRVNELYRLEQWGEALIYTKPLTYVYAFLSDYYEVIRDLCDFFLLKGVWKSRHIPRELSEELNKIEELSTHLQKFDESLGEKGIYGYRLRIIIEKISQNKHYLPYLRGILERINQEAQKIISGATGSFIIVGTILKQLYDDWNQGTLLLNWQNIKSTFILQCLKETSQKILDITYLIRSAQEASEGTGNPRQKGGEGAFL